MVKTNVKGYSYKRNGKLIKVKSHNRRKPVSKEKKAIIIIKAIKLGKKESNSDAGNKMIDNILSLYTIGEKAYKNDKKNFRYENFNVKIKKYGISDRTHDLDDWDSVKNWIMTGQDDTFPNVTNKQYEIAKKLLKDYR